MRGDQQRRWRKLPGNRKKERERTRERWRTDPRVRCRRALQNAKRRGKVKAEPCRECGGTEHIEAHHDNYDEPFNVVWLCRECHRELTQKVKAKAK
jgi:hypothetical protein